MNGHKPFWRCSLGWAVRTDEDVACCQATDSVASCWVAHPELKASLEEGQTAENVEPRAAD